MRFRNHDPAHSGPTHWQVFRWAIAERLLGRRGPASPGPPASAVAPDLQGLRVDSGDARITWIGHSSFLVQLAGVNFLFDPVFSSRVARVYPRHGTPGLAADQLPPIDVLLVSHNHYDHLDLPSIDGVGRDGTAVVPRGLGKLFTQRLFARVVELDWWEATSLGDVTITLTSARHWSQRTPFDFNRTLWGGFVIQSPTFSYYFAGDTAWCDVFAEVGRRFPKLDAALIPIGGYEPQWFMSQNHLNPEEAGRAFLDSGARTLIPMHWGTFQLADEPLREPIERLEAWWSNHAPPDRSLARLAVGETWRSDAHDRSSPMRR
ncbi:MAG: MBL fold metallo-hydrolase [Planctomycetaceae bacterium]|nr:MBL fold metallo-hydrolase [Planctomycetaceae bacterium]